MPDWTYEPLFRPTLFRLSPTRSRDLTLRALGRLARMPGGLATIGFLGHMDPPANLATELAGIRFPGPVGLGAGLDADARAFAALARFGFGFIEAGPATVAPRPDPGLLRPGGSATLICPDPLANPGAAALTERLQALGALPVPLGARLAIPPGTALPTAAADLRTLVRALGPLADYLVVDVPDAWEPQPVIAATSATSVPSQAPIWPETAWAEILAAAVAEARALDPPLPLFLRVPPDAPGDQMENRFGPAVEAGFAGAIVAGGVALTGLGGVGEARRVGAGTRAAAIGTVRALRERWGRRVAIIGSGGIVEPGDALAMLDAGADLVQIHSGLVFGGPGLPKRINEALRWRMGSAGSVTVALPVQPPHPETPTGTPSPVSPPLWLGFLLLGLLMIVGGGLAWFVGATWVILAYDLAFLGLDRAGVAALNPRLLDFMSHDRITLAGTMISIGVLYTALAWQGVRRHEHWARRSIMLSAGVGLASFFLFVFHGYFDPLHFVQWVVALLCFAVGRRWRADAPPLVPAPDLANDRAWRAATAGQLLFVILGIGLIGGGLTIAALGSTAVFVPEDLEFLRTTRAAVAAANPNLLPLIAHDRAGFGGALVADGLAVLTLALWGFRRGARWVWAALLLAGLPGLVAALGIHLSVGYLDAGHLAPPALALGLYVGGLLLSRSYLCKAEGALPSPWLAARCLLPTEPTAAFPTLEDGHATEPTLRPSTFPHAFQAHPAPAGSSRDRPGVWRGLAGLVRRHDGPKQRGSVVHRHRIGRGPPQPHWRQPAAAEPGHRCDAAIDGNPKLPRWTPAPAGRLPDGDVPDRRRRSRPLARQVPHRRGAALPPADGGHAGLRRRHGQPRQPEPLR